MKNVATKSEFITPEGVITLSNVVIDHIRYTFTAEVLVKVGRKKAIKHEVSGKISTELRQWLVLKDKPIYIEVADEDGLIHQMKTDQMTTGFKKYLAKRGIEFEPGILSRMIFKGKNHSEVYHENPFRIVMMANGYTVMTLVNVPSKRRQVTEDPNTGLEKVSYSTKKTTLKNERGTFTIPAYYDKKQFRRFVYQQVTEL